MTFLQKPYFDLKSDWTPPNPADLPAWAYAKRVAVDIETCDPQLTKLGPGVRRGGFIAGVSFALDGGPSHYLPIAHLGGDNMDKEVVLRYLRDQAAVFTGEIVGANLPYDLDYLAEQNIIYRRASAFRDVIVGSVLCSELFPRNSLDDCLKRFGLVGKNEDGLMAAGRHWCLGTTMKQVKGSMWKLPARYVGPYAIGDVTEPLELLELIDKEIKKQELEDIWELESKVLPVTVKIRRRGVRIDLDRLEQIKKWAFGEETKFLNNIEWRTGVKILPEDVAKKGPIDDAMRAVGFVLPKTTTGQPMCNIEILEQIDHDVPRWFIRAKKFHKMRCDFAVSVQKHMTGGRIHATFRQVKGSVDGREDDSGAAYGRFSCTDPNLQQQYSPEKEKEISGMWRKIYLPEEGAKWVSADYSAQEPRVLVHYAAKTGCEGGEEMVQKYLDNPWLDLHQATADLCGIERKPAKIILLGLCYGMGGAKLCRDLGLPTELWKAPGGDMIPVAGKEGRELLNQFSKMVPFVKELSDMCMLRADRYGSIRTLGGRKCRFSKKFNGEYDFTYKALNRLIQGSSGDQGKQALVDADNAGFYIQIPVHDELCGSVQDQEEGEKLGKIMTNAIPLKVPVVVDVATGASWGEAA